MGDYMLDGGCLVDSVEKTAMNMARITGHTQGLSEVINLTLEDLIDE